MIAYLLESSLAWLKKCRLLFSNYCVFATVKRVETDSSPQRLVLYLYEREKKVNTLYSPETFPSQWHQKW